ncbi:DUF3732 domain-containing protein [Tenacibaculum maritimum]|uniref:DUF3732 domain-containing protein n=1 Tax=Tenacibaculum maritimum TaxID=107401 RepID=UPI0012E54416|nr:DUF3732 domain-containing protein [Tenacibaculum maritimum]MCD9582396.1 DUF3732 domain-containing protein [Tenacibaculum maritimum]MCD9636811.1 DUF3732 domain-containing protein [Tenacibaculum maritimum]CAA0221953.1 conserved hypothetical protein [Tenacibaculum maritimum]
MKFILHEIKLWFKDENSEPKSYKFLADKINVITGDATTGKTSFWSIIDYCLLSSKINVANTINDKVLWFGLRFTINSKAISIVRKTPVKGAVSSEVYFGYGDFPANPKPNIDISEIKSILDEEFGITDELRFPYGKGMGKSTFNISYRHFLLFNSLTETIIGAPETYFDTTFYGKDEYDEALSHIFDLVIGVNDMENLKAIERLQEIDRELKKIQNQERGNQRNYNKFETSIYQLIDKSKEYKFIEYSTTFDNVDDALISIQEIISNTRKKAENQKLFSDINKLYQRKSELQSQINAISQYQKEYRLYKNNLKKSADSLQPIEFLNKKLSDQLVDSYETKLFIESLELSLRDIKESISKKITEPLQVNGDYKSLKTDFDKVSKEINQLNEIKKNYQAEGEKFIVLGEIKYAYEQIVKSKKHNPIDNNKLNSLNVEKSQLEKVPEEIKQIKYIMKTQLDESIQRNYNKLDSLPSYQDHYARFDENEMILKLFPQDQIFPLDNVGSKSNYMFMHLCFYLGLHEHMINLQQVHVPQFLFIDQPSIPYYTSDDDKGNDDRTKLVDAFTLLNSFVEYITVEKNNNFQIFMVEHAPKEYWVDNNLTHFHLVDEFINGKGLIPNEVYNN